MEAHLHQYLQVSHMSRRAYQPSTRLYWHRLCKDLDCHRRHSLPEVTHDILRLDSRS